MLYPVKKHRDSKTHYVRVCDEAFADFLKGLWKKFQDLIQKALAACVSKLQGTGIGRKIASLLQRILDKFKNTATEATSTGASEATVGETKAGFSDVFVDLGKAEKVVNSSGLDAGTAMAVSVPIRASESIIKTILDKMRTFRPALGFSGPTVETTNTFGGLSAISNVARNSLSASDFWQNARVRIMRLLKGLPFNPSRAHENHNIITVLNQGAQEVARGRMMTGRKIIEKGFLMFEKTIKNQMMNLKDRLSKTSSMEEQYDIVDRVQNAKEVLDDIRLRHKRMNDLLEALYKKVRISGDWTKATYK